VGIDPECDRRVSVTEPGGPAGRRSRPQRAHDDRARSPGRAVRFAPGMLSPRKFTTWRIGRPAGRLSGPGLEAASPPALTGCAAHGTGPPLRPQDCFAPRARSQCRVVRPGGWLSTGTGHLFVTD